MADATKAETIAVSEHALATTTSEALRVTQVPVEVLELKTPALRVTQTPVEVLELKTPALRVTQVPVEVAWRPLPALLVTHVPIEVLYPTYTEEHFEVGDTFGPLIWAELAEPGGTTYVAAPVDLPDPASYYHGYKAPTLLGAGRMRRALSDDEGQYEAQRFTVTVDDTARRWRTYLGARDVTRLLLNRRVVCRMISDDGRRALQRPRTVAIGLVRGYTLE